jgi:hypothetical protein
LVLYKPGGIDVSLAAHHAQQSSALVIDTK